MCQYPLERDTIGTYVSNQPIDLKQIFRCSLASHFQVLFSTSAGSPHTKGTAAPIRCSTAELDVPVLSKRPSASRASLRPCQISEIGFRIAARPMRHSRQKHHEPACAKDATIASALRTGVKKRPARENVAMTFAAEPLRGAIAHPVSQPAFDFEKAQLVALSSDTTVQSLKGRVI